MFGDLEMRRNNQLSTYCTFNISYCPKKWPSSGPFLIRFTTSVRLNTSGRTLSGTTSCILISHVLVIPLLGFLNTETQKLINDFFPLSYNSADSNKRVFNCLSPTHHHAKFCIPSLCYRPFTAAQQGNTQTGGSSYFTHFSLTNSDWLNFRVYVCTLWKICGIL